MRVLIARKPTRNPEIRRRTPELITFEDHLFDEQLEESRRHGRSLAPGETTVFALDGWRPAEGMASRTPEKLRQIAGFIAGPLAPSVLILGRSPNDGSKGLYPRALQEERYRGNWATVTVLEGTVTIPDEASAGVLGDIWCTPGTTVYTVPEIAATIEMAPGALALFAAHDSALEPLPHDALYGAGVR